MQRRATNELLVLVGDCRRGISSDDTCLRASFTGMSLVMSEPEGQERKERVDGRNWLVRTRGIDCSNGFRGCASRQRKRAREKERERELVEIVGSISILIKMDSRCNQAFTY